MSINSLTSWITSSNKFQREYTCLLKKSVCSQISNLIRDNSENDENIVDWAYLISCASILAHSTDGTVLDIAYPEDDDAQEKYLHIIGRISSNLTGDSYKLNAYRSVLITNWLRGYGLARIIADNIRWHNKNKTGKNTATIIRETMRDIEEYARFRFLKYTTCYIDVLKLYLGTKGDCAAIDKIPQLNLWLEFGASKTTQISLMAMGFTRTAALEFSDLIVDENYNKEQCLHWFQTNNIYSAPNNKTCKATERQAVK